MSGQARMPLSQSENTHAQRAAFGRWLLAAVLCLSGTGCRQFMNAFRPDPFGPNAKCQIDPTLAPQQLVARVNANAAKIHGWRSSSATISGSNLPLSLKGTTVAVEAPRNFRLLAKQPFGARQVADLGSNDDRFWFWFEDPKHPDSEVILCNHQDMAYAARAMPIPFEPDWLMEVMGVQPIVLGPDSNFVEREGFLEIYSKRISPSGQPVQKRTTIDRCHATVVEHALLDAGGQMIAQANLSEYIADPNSGAYLAGRVDLKWPQADMQLTIRLDAIEFNPTSRPIQFQVPQGMPVRQIPTPEMAQDAAAAGEDYATPYPEGAYQPLQSMSFDEQ